MLFCPKEKVEKKYGVDYNCLERPQNYQYMAPRAGRPMDDTRWWRDWGMREFTLHHIVHHHSGILKLKRTQKAGRGQCWAAILKTVSFKAIQIHNF